MINLGVQYYRPPFPVQKYWAEDFRRIRDAGLNCVQLWILWSWVESKPGTFRFEDYDRLVGLAAENDLGVVLSLVGEVQPCWIHREVPGSEMVNHMGHKVVSSNREECHFGITPGGCTDHPGVWERMAQFLTQVTERYRGAAHLRGWDVWNELRWNVHADGLVCYCEHTLRAFRRWLDERFGGLDGLNAAWLRRYSSWEEVLPGKAPERPYTEMMAFEHFLTERANRHARARYDLVKKLSPDKPATVHGPWPTPLWPYGPQEQTLNRGNDWDLADHLDGIGTSSFPKWQNLDDVDYMMRMEFTHSAARGKRMWLSEIQGGRAGTGFDVHKPVDAASQQRWIWSGIASGADTVLFWCWRDEVFGREAGGFGIAGSDGFAEERLAALRTTGRILGQYGAVLEAYRPDPAKVGVLFSPQSYYLHWAQDGKCERALSALQGYCRALIRQGIPYTVVEENHLDALSGLKILFMPRTLVVDDATAARLGDFVRCGGTLVCESECGAFDSRGLYRYPEERFTAVLSGACEVGRRTLESPEVMMRVGGRDLALHAMQWFTPWALRSGEVFASGQDGVLAARVPVGKGAMVLCGSYFGNGYNKHASAGFGEWIEHLTVQAGAIPSVRSVGLPEGQAAILRSGRADGRRVLLAICPQGTEQVELALEGNFFRGPVRDILSGKQVEITSRMGGQRCIISAGDWRASMLIEEEGHHAD